MDENQQDPTRLIGYKDHPQGCYQILWWKLIFNELFQCGSFISAGCVDIKKSMQLIFDIEIRRFSQMEDMSNNWITALPPYKAGCKIRSQVDFHYYHVVVGDDNNWWDCRVSHRNLKEKRAYSMREGVMGSHF